MDSKPQSNVEYYKFDEYKYTIICSSSSFSETHFVTNIEYLR